MCRTVVSFFLLFGGSDDVEASAWRTSGSLWKKHPPPATNARTHTSASVFIRGTGEPRLLREQWARRGIDRARWASTTRQFILCLRKPRETDCSFLRTSRVGVNGKYLRQYFLTYGKTDVRNCGWKEMKEKHPLFAPGWFTLIKGALRTCAGKGRAIRSDEDLSGRVVLQFARRWRVLQRFQECCDTTGMRSRSQWMERRVSVAIKTKGQTNKRIEMDGFV